MGGLRGTHSPPACGGQWLGLLLSAAILGSCPTPALAQTQIIVTPDLPPAPVVGGTVTLTPQPPPPPNATLCGWLRQSRTIFWHLLDQEQPSTGSSYTGREVLGPGCSLIIVGLMLNYSGSYTLQVQGPGVFIFRGVNLRVYGKLARPTVMSRRTTVPENGILELFGERPPSTRTLLWYRDGTVLRLDGHVEMSPGNLSLLLARVRRDDAGNYTCEVRNPISTARSEPVTVTVTYGPDAAFMNPSGLLSLRLGDKVTLRCAADSVPAPQFSWSHSGSDLIPAPAGAVLSLVLTSAEQAGVYECHVTNPSTGQNATASVSITLRLGQGPVQSQPGQTGGLQGGAITRAVDAGIIIGSLAGTGLLIFVLYYVLCTQGKRDPRLEKDPVAQQGAPCPAGVQEQPPLQPVRGQQSSPGAPPTPPTRCCSPEPRTCTRS
ncbi:carcinoembryonic antigen-related cell adhesion molecule 5 isoform X2 [Alligator mississippiensis]|uniref:carcinoembryonic antigen-related cell adhesion molecule 5 isoform X2 n=1 Tax=Alligator mississippiensis TaxID=8496 RepID=UPI00071129CC|nr:carcinoembryonic antigen-related cell adhesion molecule 5 isoform X2 [Alligator mississippiensis]